MATRWDKLAAIARDAASTANEKAFADRLLRDMRARGEGPGVPVGLQESWELALLAALCAKHEATFQEGILEGENVEALLIELTRLHPHLEEIVIAATAGFLASQFPVAPVEGTAARASDTVTTAAFTIGRTVAPLPERKLLADHRSLKRTASSP